jgi:hypothetical protein
MVGGMGAYPTRTGGGGGGGGGGMPMRSHGGHGHYHHSSHHSSHHALVPGGGGAGGSSHHHHHHRRSRHGRHGRPQKHYDSSSMSSSSGSDSDSDADANFHKYQRTKWKEDLRSIQPINGGKSSSGGVLDRFGRRDLGRCIFMSCTDRWGLLACPRLTYFTTN